MERIWTDFTEQNQDTATVERVGRGTRKRPVCVGEKRGVFTQQRAAERRGARRSQQGEPLCLQGDRQSDHGSVTGETKTDSQESVQKVG